jgi:hypothetical protein
MTRLIGDAFVRIRPDTSRTGGEVRRQLSPQIAKAGQEHGRMFGTSFVRASAGPFRAMGGILTRSLGGVIAGLGAVAGIHAFAGFITDARDSAKVASLTAATIKATGGAAKITAIQVGNLATAISNKTGKDDEAIQSGQNMLLTFKGIRDEAGKNNRIFDQASTVLTDMVSAMNGGVVTEENMRKGGIQLGKALNDPIKGISALQRVGVTFTAKQKDQIAAMVKVGNVAGAQKIILKELRSEFGGAAAATSSATDKMKVALGNLGEQIGGFLLPVIDRFARLAVKTLIPGIQAMFAAFQDGTVTAHGFIGAMQNVGATVGNVVAIFRGRIIAPEAENGFTRFAHLLHDQVIPALRDIGGWLLKNRDVVLLVGGVFAAFKIGFFVQGLWAAVVATKAMIVAQGGLNAAMRANLIGIVITALAGLIALIIYAYKHSETFRNIVQGAWRGIQVAVSFAWNNVIKPTVTALVWYFRNVVAPTALWLWNNVLKPAWVGISTAVKIASVVIQVALKLWILYLQNVVFPVIRFLWNNVVRPVFTDIAAKISFVWTKIIRPVFSALGSFIKDKVAPAFVVGVTAIRVAWEKVKDAAKAPVSFVINRVINPLIGGFNSIAGKLGVKDRIPTIPGIGDGQGGLSAPGRGNSRGTGDGLGDVLGFFKGPAKWISDKAGLGRIRDKFGNTFLTRVLTGGGRKVVDWLKDKALSVFGGTELGGLAGGKGLAGLQPGILGVLGALRRVFGNVPVISGFRPGAVTLTGHQSYHALGRAIDIKPVYAWAAFLNAAYGSRLRELITPWQNFNILNGRRHTYTGAVWAQHNFAGGNAHIHAALDDYGTRTLRPGLNIIPNNTGRPEPIGALQGMAGGPHFHFHDSVIASERQAEDLLVKAYKSAVANKRIPAPSGRIR